MMPFLCKASDVTETGREYLVSGNGGAYYVMLFRLGDQVRAYQNVCPHRFLSLSWAPDRFMIGEDGLLVCPHHGAAFELEQGECLQGPCVGDRLFPVEIRITDDEIWLD